MLHFIADLSAFLVIVLHIFIIQAASLPFGYKNLVMSLVSPANESISFSSSSTSSLLEEMLSRYNGNTFVSMKKNSIEKITEKSAAYGSYLGDNTYKLEKIVEKPALEYVKKNPTELSVAGGIYLIDEDGGNKIGKVKRGAGGEYHITDIIDMQPLHCLLSTLAEIS